MAGASYVSQQSLFEACVLVCTQRRDDRNLRKHRRGIRLRARFLDSFVTRQREVVVLTDEVRPQAG